jgi:hypothetical protein
MQHNEIDARLIVRIECSDGNAIGSENRIVIVEEEAFVFRIAIDDMRNEVISLKIRTNSTK